MAQPSEVQVTMHIHNDEFGRETARRLQIAFEPLSAEAENLINEARRKRMEKLGMQEARRGMGDTGHQLWGKNGLPNVVIGEDLFQDFSRNGYPLVNAFFKKVPARENGQVVPGAFKWMLRFTFSREQDEKPMKQDFTDRLRRFLKDKTWRNCHIWENDTSETINLTGGLDTNCRKVRQLRFDPRVEEDYADKDESGVEIRGNYRAVLVQIPKPDVQPKA